ncbi:hypothetical protein Cni_G26788 [Canna indica]|uniref:Uncharacterized protein n=1 Tax=Canna indica TaxID=4628 RepID=A0AAQ3L0C7_9LILI|nr:hypothetical protein Cni_G26788 [Canna indica]
MNAPMLVLGDQSPLASVVDDWLKPSSSVPTSVVAMSPLSTLESVDPSFCNSSLDLLDWDGPAGSPCVAHKAEVVPADVPFADDGACTDDLLIPVAIIGEDRTDDPMAGVSAASFLSEASSNALSSETPAPLVSFLSRVSSLVASGDCRASSPTGRPPSIVSLPECSSVNYSRLLEHSFIPSESGLDSPFSLDEIKSAIWDMGLCKAPGPDDLNTEFFRIFWDTIKVNLLQIFNEFLSCPSSLRRFNYGHIVMLPKFEGASRVKDFRPISVENNLIRIFSKGFSAIWIHWLRCLLDSESNILVNGSLETPFRHKRGVRQGTPSPPLSSILRWTIFLDFFPCLLGIFLLNELSPIRLSKADWLSLVAKIDARLSSWQGKLLSRARRRILINSSITSSVAYLLSMFKDPSWILKLIDPRRKKFVWSGVDVFHLHGRCMVGWDKVSCSLEEGGLGILNLRVHSLARWGGWIWKVIQGRDLFWVHLMEELYGNYRSWFGSSYLRRASPLWKDLLSLFELFKLGTTISVGDGTRTRASRNFAGWNISFSTFVEVDRLLALASALEPVHHSSGDNEIEWKWGSNGSSMRRPKTTKDGAHDRALRRQQQAQLWKQSKRRRQRSPRREDTQPKGSYAAPKS